MPMRLVLIIVSATFESAKGVVCREKHFISNQAMAVPVNMGTV
jgi:hypothetical protein